MKCQILFSGENKKNIIYLSSSELAKREVRVKALSKIVAADILNIFFFQRKYDLAIHVNCPLGRRFTRNVFFFSKKKLKNQNVICCSWINCLSEGEHPLLERETPPQVHFRR